jgi:hypothetical protein
VPFFVCLFQFIFLHFFYIILDLFMYFQEFQVVSRVTFTRSSLHARLHSR